MSTPSSADKAEVHGQSSLIQAAFAIEIDDPAQIRAQNEGFCSPGCGKEFGKCCGWELLIVIPLAVIAAVISGAAGAVLLVLAAIAPAVVIMVLTEKFYRHAVTRCQMTVSFFEAILWMIPLVIWLLIFQTYISGPMGLREGSGLSAQYILSYAFNAYIMAGLFEETLKFLCINRLVNKPFIVDPRSLFVYAVCSGAGFASAENILYVTSGGYATAIVRAFMSVPLHCAWACLTGMSLAEGKFRERNDPAFLRYAKAVALPILLHGTYDFGLFVGAGFGTTAGVLAGTAVALLVLVISLCLVRMRGLEIARSFAHKNIHAQIHDGEAPPPCSMCAICLPACCAK